MADREFILKVVDELSSKSLDELENFVQYLRFKEQHEKDWFEKVYDLFAPVRKAAEALTEEEINTAIDIAIDEVNCT